MRVHTVFDIRDKGQEMLNMTVVVLQLKETKEALPVYLLYVWSSLKSKEILAKEAKFMICNLYVL